MVLSAHTGVNIRDFKIMHLSIKTPTPRPKTDRGFDKGPHQILPKPPAPGENLEIKFPSPWEQIGKGFKKTTTNKQTKQDKETVHTELIRNKIYLNKAIDADY